MLIKQDDCCLLVIDVQARLLRATYNPVGVARSCRALLEAGHAAGIPVLVTEHYPQGLGHTADALAPLVHPDSILEKIYFSCFAEVSARRRIRETGKGTLVVAGMEAHVCLGQTALDLIDAGYRVIVSADGTASRRRLDHETALYRLEQAGAEIVPTAEILAAWRADASVRRPDLERMQ